MLKEKIISFITVAAVATTIAQPAMASSIVVEDATNEGSFAISNEPNTPADASKFVDIKGHWAEDALLNAVNNGLLYGKDETHVAPNDYITRAEMAALMSRFVEANKSAEIGSFVDIKSDSWYYEYVGLAVQMGALKGNGNAMNPSGRITRQEAAVVFNSVFNLYGYSANLSQYSDNSSVATYARDAMSACVGAGVIHGSNGKLEPNRELTRAEFCAMMYSLVQTYINSKVPFNGDNISGSAVVTVPNATLNNITISGNLYLGDGISSGATLDGVHVSGSVYVRGATSFDLVGNATANQVVVYNPSDAVEVDATRGKIGTTVIDTALSGVTLTGNVGSVKMNSAKAMLTFKNAIVDTLNTPVILPTVSVDKGTTIEKFVVPEAATGALISNSGKVKDVEISADATEFTTNSGSNIESMQILGSTPSLIMKGDSVIDILKIVGSNTLKLSTERSSEIKSLTSDSSKAEVIWKCLSDGITIGDSSPKITFDTGSSIKSLKVEGDKVTVSFGKSGTCESAIVTGDDMTLNSDGGLKNVTFEKGATGATLNVKSITITNKSGATITVNDNKVETDRTVEVDSDGKIISTVSPSVSPSVSPKPTGTITPQPSPTPSPTVPPTESPEPSVGQTSSCTLKLANNLNSSDISTEENLGFSDFCALGALSSDLVVTGSFYEVPSFTIFGDMSFNRGFYIPIVVNSAYINPGSAFTVTVNKTTYTAENISYGDNYSGKLIVYVPIYANAATNENGRVVVDLVFDADGDGTDYTRTYYSIDCTEVLFNYVDTFSLRAKNIQGATNSETDEYTQVLSAATTGVREAVASFYSDSISVTDMGESGKGNWAGVTLLGPASAKKLLIKDTSGVTQEYAAGELRYFDRKGNSVSNSSEAYFELPTFTVYFDVSKSKSIKVEATWANLNDIKLGSTETYTFDLSGVSTSDDEISTPVADSISLEKETEEYLNKEYSMGLRDFSSAYNIATTGSVAYLAGTYFKTVLPKDTGLETGYYVPAIVKVTGLVSDASLYIGETKLGNVLLDSGAEQSVHVLIPISSLGSTVNGFTLQLKDAADTGKSSVNIGVNTTQSAVSQTEIRVIPVPLGTSETLYGSLYSEYIQTPYDVAYGTNIQICATANYTEISEECDWSKPQGWFVPVRIVNTSSYNDGWNVTVSLGEYDGAERKSFSADAGTPYLDILVPVAYPEESSGIFYEVSFDIKGSIKTSCIFDVILEKMD